MLDVAHIHRNIEHWKAEINHSKKKKTYLNLF